MAKAVAISFKEFCKRYSTEDACREELGRNYSASGFPRASFARNAVVLSIIFSGGERFASAALAAIRPLLPPGLLCTARICP